MFRIISSLIFLFFVSTSLYADTITLKSGKIVEGRIVQETDDYIKVKSSGFTLTYFKDAISKIEKEVKQLSKQEELKQLAEDIDWAENQKKEPEQDTLFLQEFSNDYISLKKPAIWELTSQYLYPYKSFCQRDLTVISHKAAYDEGLIIFGQKDRPKKPLSFNNIIKYIEEEIDQEKVVNRPSIKYLNGERVINFALNKEYNSKAVVADITVLFRGKRWYVLELVVLENKFLAYRDMFKEIKEAIELH